VLCSCESLGVSYRQDDGSVTPALVDVSLSLNAGERIAIIGGNGSGKSTLGLCLAGLIQPSKGRVRTSPPLDQPPYGAIVFQSPEDNLIGATVRDELEFTLDHAARPESQADLEGLCARLRLADLLDRPTSRLSGGQKQMVALGSALLSGKSLIVLDEPTSHLDPPGRREFLAWLLEALPVAGSSPAVVFVTQYDAEARLMPRVLELNQGHVLYDGPSQQWQGFARDAVKTLTLPSPKAAAALSASELTQRANPGWPLPATPVRDVHLTIHEGEAIALCGPIGAGKTTLALMLAGLIRSDGRLVHHAGKPVMLIQFPERQLFCSTALEEVAYGLKQRGIGDAEAKTRSESAMARLGLDPVVLASRQPWSLSGGQRRRLMLAAAAAIPAPLFILDEPQAALDPAGLRALRDLCRTWLEEDRSYLLISHDLDFLRTTTARALVMRQGQVIFDGTWSELDADRSVLSKIGFEEGS
jgi:energy-coupling factor transport system ATP-binding protein